MENVNLDSDSSTLQPPLDAESSATADALKKRSQNGRMWLCAGVGFMGTSFATNYLLFHSDGNFHLAMYVLTSLGAACMLKAMADILGF